MISRRLLIRAYWSLYNRGEYEAAGHILRGVRRGILGLYDDNPGERAAYDELTKLGATWGMTWFGMFYTRIFCELGEIS